MASRRPRNLDEAREDFLKANYIWLKRLCKDADFRARLSFDWALVLGVATAEAGYYVYNYVQTQSNPSTVRVCAPVPGMRLIDLHWWQVAAWGATALSSCVRYALTTSSGVTAALSSSRLQLFKAWLWLKSVQLATPLPFRRYSRTCQLWRASTYTPRPRTSKRL